MDAAEAQLAGLRAVLSAAEGGGAQIGAEALVAALRALRSSVAADTERCQRIGTERDAVAAQVQEMAAANAKLRYQIGHLQRAHEAPAPEPEAPAKAPAPEAKPPQAETAEGGGEMEAQPGDFAFYACVGVRVWVVPPDGAAGWGGVVTRGPDAELGVWHVRREVTNVGLDDGWPREEAVPHEWLRARRRFAPSGASRERLGRSYEWSAALPDPAPAPASASAPAPAPKRKKVRKVVSSSSSSSDEEPTEEEKVYWARAEAILAEYSLSKMAMAAAKMWIKEMGHPVKGKSLHRVQVWFLHRMQGRVRSPPSSTWQSGCPEIIPKLTARPWWSAEHLGWLSKLQAGLDDVVSELRQLRGQGVFQPYRAPSWAGGEKAADGVGKTSTDRGKWNIFYLQLHEAAEFTDENSKRCPKTVELLRSAIPKGRAYGHAFFSALSPNTHITKHHGPTNKKLRVHLPLIGTDGSRLRVADDTRDINAGEAMAFDDSFEHEAWHDGTETRITLIVDIWHPDLTDREVKFLGHLQRSRMKAERKRSDANAGADADDDFFSLLRRTRGMSGEDSSWWQ